MALDIKPDAFFITNMQALTLTILKNSLLPMLDWESRFNLNMALPFTKRQNLQFSRDEADWHDRCAIIETIRTKLLLIDDIIGAKQITYTSELIIMLTRPRYRLFTEMNPTFKSAAIAKLKEHSNGSALKRRFHNHNKEQLSELARLSRLVRKVLAEPVKVVSNSIKNLPSTWKIIRQ
jgi:hypothetical protein